MSEKRIEWIDSLKGIGIILVVIGHVLALAPGEILVKTTRFIYLFHMPLFFVIGGMLFKPSDNGRAFLWKKTVHLLIPYLTFLVILYFPAVLEGVLTCVEKPDFSSFLYLLSITLKGAYGGRVLTGGTTIFWFVTCFFLTQQLFGFLHRRFSDLTIVVLTIISLNLGYLNAYFLSNLILPWNINVVLAALPFFTFGFYSKKLNMTKTLYVTSGFLSLLSIVLIGFGYRIAYDMMWSVYGVPYISFILSLSVIICLIGVSKLCSGFALLDRSLAYFGAASMVIMYLHNSIILDVNYLLIFTNHEFYRNSMPALWIMFTFGILMPVIFYSIFKQRRWMRAIFLGSSNDFEALLDRMR